jgi:Holliday junction resolvasome RuvABC endonuclease subunit
MSDKQNDVSEHEMFVTEFPKNGYGIVDYLQGRVHFALLDQMKLMTSSGMTQNQIKEAIIANVTKIIDNFEPEKESKSS